ncbi:MAG: glycosyltransferase [Ferruginibacter sp.]
MQLNNSISIVICCYNSSSLLPGVLQAIAQQKNIEAGDFEILVVNNNSTDNTKAVALQYFSLPALKTVYCKVVDEPEPGLSAAREKGFKESAYDYVLFCDDDNLMNPDFIANAMQLIKEKPGVDIFGSWCEGEFETPPPDWSKDMITSLAVGRPAEKTGFLQKPVNGACMIVKKSSYVALKNKSFQFLLSDRKGNILTSGGDTELCYAMLLSGGIIYFSEKLFFNHFIPTGRLQKKYFKKLYLIPAKQFIVGLSYQWILNNKEASFTRFYFSHLFNYPKIFGYCIKQSLLTGQFFCYTLLFRQRFNFMLYSLFLPRGVKADFDSVTTLSKKLKD